jgi:hypothetical protein
MDLESLFIDNKEQSIKVGIFFRINRTILQRLNTDNQLR